MRTVSLAVDVDSAPVSVDHPPQPYITRVPSRRYLSAKYRTEQIAGAGLLVASLPLMAAVALAVRLSIGRGVVYRQRRVGRHGAVFTMFKFRTMDPDRRVRDVAVAENRRRTHKTIADPRHTRVGTFLRRTSLDELPQLLNVVRGDMTLIGPRPELVSIVEREDLWHHPRHLLKPGITGLWQVSEHRDELLHENLHVDVDYVERVSLRTDLGVLARTFRTVFATTGA